LNSLVNRLLVVISYPSVARGIHLNTLSDFPGPAQSDPVRLLFGQELLSWSSLGVPGARIDRQEIRSLAVNLIDDERMEVRDIVLTVLGVLDESVDVEAVLAVAKREPHGRFVLAVQILAGMCNSSAQSALLELEQYVKTEDHKEIIAAFRRKYEALKKEHPTLCT
jgi:hypothetical protein